MIFFWRYHIYLLSFHARHYHHMNVPKLSMSLSGGLTRVGLIVVFLLATSTSPVAAFSVGPQHKGIQRGYGRLPSRLSMESVKEEQKKERDMEALKGWANQNGVSVDNDVISLSNPQGDCWGFSVPQDSQQGTTILKVPASIVINSQQIQDELALHHDLSPAIEYLESKKVHTQIPQFFLFLKLLMEYSKESDSAWYSWIQSLPQVFDTAVCMDAVELECLLPFAWALASVERLHLEVFKETLTMLPKTLAIDPESIQNQELMAWIFNSVFTRCWRYPDEVNDNERCDIVPLGDMFNHAQQNMEIDYDDDGNVIFSLAHDLPSNSPLHLSYGLATNPYRLLVIFGFVDELQPELFCQIIASNPSDKLVELGYDTKKMVFRTQDGAISNAVWDVVLYLILTQVPELQEAFYEAHVDGDKHFKATMHAQFQLEASMFLKSHVQKCLQEIDTALEKIKIENESEHSRLGLIRQHTEFMHRTFQKVQQNLDQTIQSEMERRRGLQN
jgi:hypothetical protein